MLVDTNHQEWKTLDGKNYTTELLEDILLEVLELTKVAVHRGRRLFSFLKPGLRW